MKTKKHTRQKVCAVSNLFFHQTFLTANMTILQILYLFKLQFTEAVMRNIICCTDFCNGFQHSTVMLFDKNFIKRRDDAEKIYTGQ